MQFLLPIIEESNYIIQKFIDFEKMIVALSMVKNGESLNKEEILEYSENYTTKIDKNRKENLVKDPFDFRFS